MTPQKATLDSLRTLSRFVSYRRLSSQFQFSLSLVTLEYLSQWTSLSGAGGPRRYGGCTVKETARMTRLLYPNPEELALKQY
jgi:hypothetical protein